MTGAPHLAADEAEERLVRGYAGRLSVTVGFGLVAVNAGRQSLSPLLPAVIADLGITPSRAGLALTVMWALFATVQYPGGRLSDQLSRRTVLAGAFLVTIAGLLTLAMATSYPLLLMGTALLGAGAGAYIVSMRALLSDLFEDRRGEAVGLNQAAGNVGSALAAGLAIVVLSIATWRTAFLPVAAGVAIAFVALNLWSREPLRISRVSLDIRPTLARVFGASGMRWLVVAYSLVIVTWNGVLGFLPTFLQFEKGLAPAIASAGFAIPFITGMVAMPVAGRLSDRLPRLSVAAGGLVVSAIGLGLLVVVDARPIVLAAIVVFAGGLMTFPPVMQAYLLDAFPGASAGGDFGAFRTVYMFVGSLGPAYVGFAAERAGFAAAFAGIVACLLASAAITSYLRRA